MSLDPATAALDLANTIAGVVNKVVKDPNQAAQINADIEKMRLAGDLQIAVAQIGVNTEDAKSGSKFQAWWRPYLAWWCVNAFAYHFVVFPVFKVIFTQYGMSDIDQTSTEILGGVLMTLIGARTWDKTKGVDSK